ncbi:MAG: DNA polymerase III subunit delta [Clostridiales bacterium]|nr:MAG: DNA polymerase III subunit delta [Clostridiales bacterium]
MGLLESTYTEPTMTEPFQLKRTALKNIQSIAFFQTGVRNMDLNKLIVLPDVSKQRVFFIEGDEKYIADKFIEHMSKKYLDGCMEELNFHKLEQASNIMEIEEKAVTLPFMCGIRIVVVEDFIKIASDSFNSKEDMDDFVEKVPESTMLILLNESVDKRSFVYKYFKKNKLVVEAKRLSPDAYDAWVEDFLKDRGISISKADKINLIKQLGYFRKENPSTLYDSESELNKLIGSIKGRTAIEKNDFDGFLNTKGETNIFKLTDSLSEGKTAYALESLETLCEMGEPEIKILFMISRHFRQIMKVKSMAVNGFSKDETMKTLGIKSDFVYKKTSRQGKNLDMGTIEKIMDLCMSTELKCKSLSSQKRMALEVLICEIGNSIYERNIG